MYLPIWTPEQDRGVEIDYVRNQLFDPTYFNNRMRDFYPVDSEKEFQAVYDSVFSSTLAEQVSREKRTGWQPDL